MGPFPWKAIRINELEIFNKITQYKYLNFDLRQFGYPMIPNTFEQDITQISDASHLVKAPV